MIGSNRFVPVQFASEWLRDRFDDYFIFRKNKLLDRFFYYSRILGVKGFVASIMGKLAGHPKIISIRRNDTVYPISLRVPSSDLDAYEQIFLQEQYKFETTKQPSVIIDAGANVGLASIYFANRFPSARIFAIECERSNFEVLKLNAEPYKNITPIHAALWGSDGEIQIVDPGLGQWGFMTAVKTVDSEASSSVRALSLNSIMREHHISHIDILKIDIEGAEFEVFNASSVWIDAVDMIIAELHDRLKPGCEQSFANATPKFTERWRQGENVYVSRIAGCAVSGA